MPIISYGNRGNKDIAQHLNSRSARQVLPVELHRNALLKMAVLDLAKSLGDLGVSSGLNLEKLSGDRSGMCSIRINKQYRICFYWKDNCAEEVEIVDYH